MRLSLQMHSLRSVDEWADLARQAEDYGFAELHIAERLDFPYPTWQSLFAMAEHTRRIVLGPGVTNPYSRHPVVTAKLLALLDRYSRGRATLGLGQGDWWQFDQLGIPHTRPLTTLREAVQVIRYLLSVDESGFSGEVFTLKPDLGLQWRTTPLAVPIFVGSRSPGGMAVAGEVADELHLPNCVAPEFVALAQAQARAGAQKAGRTTRIPLSSSPQCAISHSGEMAVRYAQLRIAGFIQWMKVPRRLLGIGEDEVTRLLQAKRNDDRDFLYRNVGERYMRAFAVAGTPRAIIEQLECLADLGIEHVTLNEPGPDLREALELLGQEVLPHFNGAGRAGSH